MLEVRLERRQDEAGLVAALDFTAANRPKILSALAEVLRYDVPSVQPITRFPAWERIVARPLMAVLGASATLKELAEAVSGAAANQDYEDFVVRLAEMADERERSALLPEDRQHVRWLTATELIADPRCNEALAQLSDTEGRGACPAAEQPAGAARTPSRTRPPAATACASRKCPRKSENPAKEAKNAPSGTSPQSQPFDRTNENADPSQTNAGNAIGQPHAEIWQCQKHRDLWLSWVSCVRQAPLRFRKRASHSPRET